MMNFFQLLEHSAAQFPHKTAVVCGSRRIDYCRLLEESIRLAAILRDHGVTCGSKAAIVSRNCIEYLMVSFACAKVGCLCIHLNIRASVEEISGLLEASGPQLLFLSGDLEEKSGQLLELWRGRLPIVAIGTPHPGAVPFNAYLEEGGRHRDAPPTAQGDEHPLLEYFTSGTTGRPKGVLHSHRAVILHTLINALEGGYRSDTIYQFSSPLFHAAAAGAYNTLAVGGTLVLIDKVEANRFLETMVRERVNFAGISPSVMRKLINSGRIPEYDLSDLKRVSYAGSAAEPVLLDRIMELLPGRDFVQYYGMTEMAPVVCVLRPEDHLDRGTADRPGHRYSAGRPTILVELKILSALGAPCALGEVGEVVVRGPCMMLGYDGVPAPISRTGWYHTGDLGWLDQDGFLFLAGRKDDIVVSGGENISCTEVERVLLTIPGVAEAAVVGVPHPDWGQAIKAYVVPAAGWRLTVEELHDRCKPKLGYKCPRILAIVPELPRNAGGKVDKVKLKQEGCSGEAL